VTIDPGQGVSTTTTGFGNVINQIAQQECRTPHVAPSVNAGAD